MTQIQTTRGALTPLEIQRYRNIVKSAIVLIVLWRLGRQSGPSEIAKILDIHRETVAGYLESLAMIGLVTRLDTRDGYRLTDDGQQLMLQVPGGYLLDEFHAQAFGSQPHELTLHMPAESVTTPELPEPIIANAMSEIPTQANREARMSEKPTFNAGKTDIQTLKKEEESLFSLKEKESPTSSLRETNVEKTDIQFPSVAVLLENSDILFEPQTVVTRGLILDQLDPELALGWLAQAWSERKHLNNPAGLVYARLKDTSRPKPRRKFVENPLEYLPRDYLVAVGLAQPETYRCEDCELDFGTDYEAWQTHREAVDNPRIEEQYRLENEQRLAEMQANLSARVAEQEVEQLRAMRERDELLRQQRGSYFDQPSTLLRFLADLFPCDYVGLSQQVYPIAQDAHTYLMVCSEVELAEALREGWQESTVEAEAQWPRLRLNFRAGKRTLNATGQEEISWMEADYAAERVAE
jgi:hypothetical protein